MSDIETVVDEVLASRIDDDVPGATVSVVEGDEVAFAKGYGHADVEAGTDVDATETAVRIGSVSKLVTWTAVMQGVEDGRLDLDADVNTYLDGSDITIPDTYDTPVTLRHLGTHTAGFDVVPNPGIVDDPGQITDLETALVENRPQRVRPPGETVAYSNWGAALAGHVVAQVYDTTFEEYVQSNVFGPLGMDHSTFTQPVPDEGPGDLAAPHDPSGSTFQRVDPVYINWLPAGSMSATATDMAAFMMAHLGHGPSDSVLSAETMSRMHSEQYDRHPAVNGWRYGFYEYGHPDGTVIAHSGATVYYTSWLGLVPDHDIGIYIGFNSRGTETPADVADEIIAEYDLQPAGSNPEPTSGPGRQNRADTVAGEYSASATPRNGDLQVLELLNRLTVRTADDGTLVTEVMGEERTEWVETDPYVYHERDGDDVLAADVVDGQVEALYLNSQPQNTFEPVAGHEQRAVTLGAVGGSLAGFALSVVGWSGLGAWRRLERRRSGSDDGPPSPEHADRARSTEEGSQ